MGIYNRSFFSWCAWQTTGFAGIPVYPFLLHTIPDEACLEPRTMVQTPSNVQSLASNSPCGCCELWSLVIHLPCSQGHMISGFGYFGPDNLGADSSCQVIPTSFWRMFVFAAPCRPKTPPTCRQEGPDQNMWIFFQGAAQAPFSVDFSCVCFCQWISITRCWYNFQ